jgi:hypothetical protein
LQRGRKALEEQKIGNAVGYSRHLRKAGKRLGKGLKENFADEIKMAILSA